MRFLHQLRMFRSRSQRPGARHQIHFGSCRMGKYDRIHPVTLDTNEATQLNKEMRRLRTSTSLDRTEKEGKLYQDKIRGVRWGNHQQYPHYNTFQSSVVRYN